MTHPARHLKVALLQMCSTTQAADNLQTLQAAMAQAADEKCDLVLTPEMTPLLERRPGALLAQSNFAEDDPTLARVSELARRFGIEVLLGSLAVKVDAHRLANRSVLFNRQGTLVAQYDKIHLFDVDLGQGERYQESARFSAGDTAVVARCAGYTLGMTVCYDLRFAQLYRDLAWAGADILAVPSAFTVPTGQAHWHTLLRARAIETGCFVLAPAQHGQHDDGRITYGHSLVVNPWGEVIAEKREGTGLLMADLDLQQVQAARAKLPSLQHSRPYRVQTVA